jgi:hypothetical protein
MKWIVKKQNKKQKQKMDESTPGKALLVGGL